MLSLGLGVLSAVAFNVGWASVSMIRIPFCLSMIGLGLWGIGELVLLYKMNHVGILGNSLRFKKADAPLAFQFVFWGQMVMFIGLVATMLFVLFSPS
jgi:hypothetical protein